MEKRKIKAYTAKVGMKIAEDVYTREGMLIIPQDTVLTEKNMERLSYYMIERITIYCEKASKECEELLKGQKAPEEVFQDRVRSTPEFNAFNQNFKEAVEVVKSEMQDVLVASENNGHLEQKRMLSSVDTILGNSRSGLHTIEMMHCMREFDDLTYVHSVNVSLLCNVIGEWLGYGAEELRGITLAGLLHDIGKIKLPAEMIKKPGRLTKKEYEIIKTHTILGYEILKKTDVGEDVSVAALLHHERSDGSGYPLGLTAEKINEHAGIVAVADVYDAMTANRVYRKGICPFEVIENFEREGIEKYNPYVLVSFLNKIVQSYIGAEVILSDGRAGEVVMINADFLSRPVVRSGDEFIDLSKKKELKIKSVVQ